MSFRCGSRTLIDGLVAEGRLDEAEQAGFGNWPACSAPSFTTSISKNSIGCARPIFTSTRRSIRRACGAAKDLEAAYRSLSEEFVRVLTEANFVEITHDEITRAFAEHARVRVKIKAPVEDYRDVRMFRRGHHTETIEIPAWFGLRKRPLEVEVYDDVVLMVATKPDGMTPADARKACRAPGAADRRSAAARCCSSISATSPAAISKALFPNVRVVMSLLDHLTLGVPALVGGVPILIKLASTMTVLFVVAGFYLGLPARCATTTWSRRWPRSAACSRWAPSCCGNGEISTASR